MPRYQPNGTPLTDKEREIIVNLMEESAEVIQAAAKLLRFGKENTDPYTGASNSYTLGLELGQMGRMVELAHTNKLVIIADIEEGDRQKLERLAEFSEHLP